MMFQRQCHFLPKRKLKSYLSYDLQSKQTTHVPRRTRYRKKKLMLEKERDLSEYDSSSSDSEHPIQEHLHAGFRLGECVDTSVKLSMEQDSSNGASEPVSDSESNRTDVSVISGPDHDQLHPSTLLQLENKDHESCPSPVYQQTNERISSGDEFGGLLGNEDDQGCSPPEPQQNNEAKSSGDQSDKLFDSGDGRCSSPDSHQNSEGTPANDEFEFFTDEDKQRSSSGDNEHDIEVEGDGDLESEQSDLDELLCPGAQITKKESLLLTMSHFLRHGLTQEALSSTLQLIKLHLPAGTSFQSSKFVFNRHFQGLCGPSDNHVYCDSCQGYVGKESGYCPYCAKNVNVEESIENGNYFITFSLANQVKHLLENPAIQAKLQLEQCDSSSGRSYKQLPLGKDGITLTWGSDGAAIFSSSNFSIWPVLFMVNELPYAIRRKHILMGGLWFGSGKPHFPAFLKPIIEEINQVSQNGIEWVDATGKCKITKVFPGALTCDSVARCQLQEIMQFNGKFGCSWCIHPGEQVPKGNGHTNAYPVADMHALPPKRDAASFQLDATVAAQSNKPSHGVKRPSIILLLLNFNIISGFVVDYMHTVCLGVARTMTFLWLESTGLPYYIGNQAAIVNERLKLIRPPSEVIRMTMPLTQRKYWKAHEWRAWLLHYSPIVLKHILPPVYYNHWMCLVTAVYMLLQNEVSFSMANKAELKSWVNL